MARKDTVTRVCRHVPFFFSSSMLGNPRERKTRFKPFDEIVVHLLVLLKRQAAKLFVNGFLEIGRLLYNPRPIAGIGLFGGLR